MAIIINIDDYRNKRKQNEERAMEALRDVLDPQESWRSDEEELLFYMEMAERDRKAERLVK